MADKRPPTIGDLLIMAGEAANDPDEAKRQAKIAVKKKVKSAMQELVESLFVEDEDDPPLKKVNKK